MNGMSEGESKEGSEQDLPPSLKENNSERRRVETYWAIGLRQLAKGERDEALVSFQKSESLLRLVSPVVRGGVR